MAPMELSWPGDSEANMELGVLIEEGPIPFRLTNHFMELIAHGVLPDVISD